MKKHNVFLNLGSLFFFLVSIAMFIPTPSSTEENYGTSMVWTLIQIAIFALSRTLLWSKKLWWLALLEVLGFALIVFIFYASLALL